ncbi:MAG: hypothetical protein ACE5F1_13205, partial [Planctomycetota bacterium]
EVVARDATLGFAQRARWRMKILPWAFSQILAQFLGARSVRKLEEGSWLYGRLDRTLMKGV